MRNTALAFVVLVTAACASTEPGDAAVAAASTQRCTRELPTGSNIPVTKCRSAEDIERDARATQAVDAAISRGGTMLRGPTGQ